MLAKCPFQNHWNVKEKREEGEVMLSIKLLLCYYVRFQMNEKAQLPNSANGEGNCRENFSLSDSKFQFETEEFIAVEKFRMLTLHKILPFSWLM